MSYQINTKSGPNPILIFGVIVTVAPIIANIFNFKWIPGWITPIGVVLIFIGAILTALNG